MQILSNPISALNLCKLPKFLHIYEIGVEEYNGDIDFRPEVEILPFRACAIKNKQYNAYSWPNCRHFRVLKEIRIEEHDDDVKF